MAWLNIQVLLTTNDPARGPSQASSPPISLTGDLTGPSTLAIPTREHAARGRTRQGRSFRHGCRFAGIVSSFYSTLDMENEPPNDDKGRPRAPSGHISSWLGWIWVSASRKTLLPHQTDRLGSHKFSFPLYQLLTSFRFDQPTTLVQLVREHPAKQSSFRRSGSRHSCRRRTLGSPAR